MDERHIQPCSNETAFLKSNKTSSSTIDSESDIGNLDQDADTSLDSEISIEEGVLVPLRGKYSPGASPQELSKSSPSSNSQCALEHSDCPLILDITLFILK